MIKEKIKVNYIDKHINNHAYKKNHSRLDYKIIDFHYLELLTYEKIKELILDECVCYTSSSLKIQDLHHPNNNDNNQYMSSAMNSLDIFLERMANIIFLENRPFCYRDFLNFELNGKEHKYKHGTIRNVFSNLRKQNKIEFVYQTTQAFYTLTGVNRGKSITPNHGEDYLQQKQKGFLQFLNQLPMDKPAIHDIRLRFLVNGLWSILSSSPSNLISNKDLKDNKDITLTDIDLKDHIIKTTIHRTDTVSVTIACSHNPIPIDIIGLAKLTSGLARVEDRLQRLLTDYYSSSFSNCNDNDGNDDNSNEDNICNNNKIKKKFLSSIPAKYMVSSHLS